MNFIRVILRNIVASPGASDEQDLEQSEEQHHPDSATNSSGRPRGQPNSKRGIRDAYSSPNIDINEECSQPLAVSRSLARLSASDPDALSASVDIDDLILEYDEPSSRRSVHETSFLSNNTSIKQPHTSRQRLERIANRLGESRGSLASGSEVQKRSSISQTYFSSGQLISSQSYKTAKDNDETISFYSALHDGFSLDEYEWRDKFGRDFLDNYGQSRSQNSRNGERDMILQASEFQVYWYDLTYKIDRPITNLSSAWEDLKLSFCKSISSSTSTVSSCLNRRRGSPNRGDSEDNDERSTTRRSGEADDKQSDEASSEGSSPRVTILQHLNGSFRSGQLMAVMGPSGAGKTSLLNILSRRREDRLTGHLYVESNDTNDKHKISINAIPQHDNLPEYLTVRENLMYASRLKNSKGNHNKNVSRVSNLLGLDDCLDTKTKSVSGGQQKRLSIAQELLSRPDILILDEPTSGLDSSTCIKTLTVLKDLVKASAKKIIDPIAIVITIHQPQLEAFNLFDKVYVMATGGLAIYDGPPNKCAEFVQKHTGISMPTPDYNPASFMIDIASGEYGQEPIDQLERQVRIEFEKARGQKLIPTDQAQTSSRDLADSDVLSREDAKSFLVAKNGLSTMNGGSGLSGGAKSLYLDSRLVKGSAMNTKGEFFYKTRVLAERCWRLMVRDPHRSATRILFHLLIPFGMTLMMGTEPGEVNACPRYRTDYSLISLMKSDQYISQEVKDEFMLAMENIGVMFITIYTCMSANAAAMCIMFTLDMSSSMKEYYNGWYSMNSYVLARVVSNIPLGILLPTITISLMYIVTGQDTGYGDMLDPYRIMITAVAVILGCFISESLGMIFGIYYMNHVTTAIFASQGAMLPFVLLSGFIARTKNMSKYVEAISMTSWFRHCLEITYIARYGWNVCGCDSSEVRFDEPRIVGISDRLQRFIDYWQNSQQDIESEQSSNSTSRDLFKMMAKQISLYNTYGNEIKSCKQVVPYTLDDFGLVENDLAHRFAALVVIWLVMFIILLLVVKFVVTYRTSL